MAAEPVSPDVAPMMVAVSPVAARARSKRRPNICMPKSLKAKVGPQNNSMRNRSRSSGMIGATASWEKPANTSAAICRRAGRSTKVEVKGASTSAATSGKVCPSTSRVGQASGT